MHPQSKLVEVFHPIETLAAATTTGTIDTLGYDYCSIDLVANTATATTKPTTLVIGEGDTSTAFTDIAATVGGTAYTMPEGPDTSGDWAVKFNIDLKGRKRYLNLQISPGTTAIFASVANLFRGEDAPINTTKAGVVALIEL